MRKWQFLMRRKSCPPLLGAGLFFCIVQRMRRKKTYVDIAAAGDRKEYASVLKKITKDGVCPFCPEHFKYHTKPILRDGKHWIVTENFAPYGGTRHHWLLLHKKHIEHAASATPAAWAELLSHIKWLTKRYKLPAGGFFMRFGDKKYTGASVTQHLHAQLLLGSPRGKHTEPIAVVLSHKKKNPRA